MYTSITGSRSLLLEVLLVKVEGGSAKAICDWYGPVISSRKNLYAFHGDVAVTVFNFYEMTNSLYKLSQKDLCPLLLNCQVDFIHSLSYY